ncbi:MAG: pyridoxamine 5'-phosphate oxidase family protein [Acidimicrobiia bacterium]|nr:pyridoxamine 5'-phosphate oxidase family protein [Acidimicrobiia bacterium]MDH5616080.1 pyridoxamine 5'-phosphate oxidase family protein [Acidimicrobiia bacterium]
MHETAEDLKNLQLLLNRSYDRAGSHLREVVTPERRVSAAQLIDLMTGAQVLALATMTADGRPLIAPVDGLFYRARFWFGSSPDSVRMRHLRTRPFVSANHTRREGLTVTVHGRAGIVDLEEPSHAGFRAFCLETYGKEWDEWGAPAVYAWIEPTKMFAAAFEPT